MGEAKSDGHMLPQAGDEDYEVEVEVLESGDSKQVKAGELSPLTE